MRRMTSRIFTIEHNILYVICTQTDRRLQEDKRARREDTRTRVKETAAHTTRYCY